MEYFIWGIFVFFVSYLFQYFLFIKKAKKYNKNKCKVEIKYLVDKYKLDMKKINYKKLLFEVSLINSICITVVFLLVLVIDSYYLKIAFAFILSFPFIFISYGILANIYKKRGLIKNV